MRKKNKSEKQVCFCKCKLFCSVLHHVAIYIERRSERDKTWENENGREERGEEVREILRIKSHRFFFFAERMPDYGIDRHDIAIITLKSIRKS